MLSTSSFICIFLSLIALLFVAAAAPMGHRNKQFLRFNESLEDATTTQRILMADSSPTVFKNIARQIGDDVEFFGEGEIELELMDLVLRFEICTTCRGTSNVCFDSGDVLSGESAAKFCPGLTSYCGFKVKVEKAESYHLSINGLSEEIDTTACRRYSMAFSNVTIQTLQAFVSCTPRYDKDGIIKLHVYANPDCRITAMNAKIHLPATASPALSPKSSNGDAASAGFFETSGGIVVIVVIVLFSISCIAATAGLVIFLLVKKTKLFKSKKSAPVESIQWNYDSTIEADECKTAIYNPNFTEFEKDLPSSKKLRAKRAAERKAAAEAKAAEKKAAAEAKAATKKKAAAEAKAAAAAEKKVKTDPTQEPTKTEENAKPPTVYDEEAPASPPLKPVAPPPALTLAEKLAPPRRKRKSKHYPRKVPSSEDNHVRIYGKALDKK